MNPVKQADAARKRAGILLLDMANAKSSAQLSALIADALQEAYDAGVNAGREQVTA